MTGLVIVAALTVGVLFLAVLLGLHVDPENAPRSAPDWAGPDAAALDAALTRVVDGARDVPPPRVPELDELAAHHAFDMATRNIAGETTPEDEDLDARRRRLHPKLVGEAAQWQNLADVDAGWGDAERAVAALVGPSSPAGTLLRESLGAEVSEVGVGAASEGGRVALVVVMMSRWATLDDTQPAPAHDGWTFRGLLGPGIEAARLTGHFRLSGGPWTGVAHAAVEDAGHQEPGEAHRFRLTLPISPDALEVEVQFVLDGIRGQVRRVG